jgi:hypothetical protein
MLWAAALLVTLLWFYFWRAPAKNVVLLVCAEYLLLLPAAIYALRPIGRGTELRLPEMSRSVFLAAFLTLASILGWMSSRGELIPDEMAYQFQAKVFALGHLTAQAPPGSPASLDETPAALRFEHHIINQGRWFGKYPWGWPLLLAVATRAGVLWLGNPLVGFAILLLMAAIAQRLFGGGAATVAVIMAVLSPFFLANCIGRMSHPACSVFLAAACLFCFEGMRTLRISPFLWMLLMITASFQVRPMTAAAVGAVLGLGTLWYLRGKHLFFEVLAWGFLFGAVCAASALLYNKLYTGSYWISPYFLSHQHAFPGPGSEIDFSVRQIVHNLTHQTRWAVQETTFYTFPFAYLLAGYAVWREREHAPEVRILCLVALVLVFAYLVQMDIGVEFIGERYYFEGFFAVPILAARGLQLLVSEQKLARGSLVPVLLLFITLQAFQIGLAGPVFWQRIKPYWQVHAAVDGLGGERYTVFLHSTEPQFVGRHFNLNRPDWANGASMFLVDPGAEQRSAWACLMGRPKWVVIGYDPASSFATTEFGSAQACVVK